MFIPLEVIMKEFAPIIVNWLVREDLIASMAVSIPIRAIIPKAIMQIVSTALTRFDLIARNEIFKFSLKIPVLTFRSFIIMV